MVSEDRAVIAAGVRQGLSYQQIGDLVGRTKSVVWREVTRHSGPDGSYWAPLAHRLAHEHRRRPKTFKLIEQPALRGQIEEWMDQGWSPKLIASVLAADQSARQHGSGVTRDDLSDQALYVQTRGRLRADLHKQLSLRRSSRRARGSHRTGPSPYRDAFKISQRPADVDDRAVPGHWEGDLILGTANGSAVGTLVERGSPSCCICRVATTLTVLPKR